MKNTKKIFKFFTLFEYEDEADNSNEIFSDNESKLQMLQKIHQRRLLPLVTIFLCAVLPNFVKGLNGEFGYSAGEIVITVFFGIMFVLYTYVFLKSFWKIKKLKEKLM